MYQRNGRWYSDFYYEGERYTKSWGAVSKTVARGKERELLNDVASGKYQRKREKVEFESFVVKYLSDKKATKKHKSYSYYISSLKPLVNFFRGKELRVIKGEREDNYKFEKISGSGERIMYLSDIHPFMVQQFKSLRMRETRGETEKVITGCTVNKSIKCLNNMFRIAKRWQMVRENPVEGIERLREKPDDVVVMTRDKEGVFFKSLEGRQAAHLKAIALLAIYTGMRKREILDLEKSRVKLKEQYLTLADTKNGEKREVPLTPFLTKALEEAIKRSPESNPYVFPSKRTGKPFTEVRKGFATAMRKAGFDHYKFHWLRHTFASRMSEAGLDTPTIMEIGGWKTDSMVKRYSHPSMDHKRRAIEKIQNEVPLILTTLAKSEKISEISNEVSSGKVISMGG